MRSEASAGIRPTIRMVWRHWRMGFLACLAGLVYSAAYFPMPNPFDEWLALPIARHLGDPGLYSSRDLLVTSGAHAPFHVYHAAAWLYRLGLDVDAWWYGALVLSLLALFAASYRLARAVGVPPAIAAVTTVLLACSDPERGTLHWSWFPNRNFVSSGAALPLALLAVAWACRRRSGPGLLLAAVTFCLHPGIGCIAASTCGVLLVLDSPELSWRRRAAWAVSALAIALINVVYTTHDTPENFHTTAEIARQYAAQFHIFAMHVFVQDYWRRGYGWFLIQLGLALLALRHLAPAPRRTLRIVIAWLLLLIVGYAGYVEIGHHPLFFLLFLFRATLVLKPLCYALIGGWFLIRQRTLTPPRRGLLIVAAGALALSALVDDITLAEGLAASGAALGLWLEPGLRARRSATLCCGGLGLAMLALFTYWMLMNPDGDMPATVESVARSLGILAGAIVVIVTLMRGDTTPSPAAPVPSERDDSSARGAPIHDTPDAPSFGWAVCATLAILAAAILNLTWDPHGWIPAPPSRLAHRLHFSVPDGPIDSLARWARVQTPRGALFLVPPTAPEFVPFRVQAGRSLYILQDDINQLAYDADAYLQAGARFARAGARIIGPHTIDASAYDTLSPDQLRGLAADGVTYAIFRQTAAPVSRPFPLVYTDANWRVYTLSAR